MKLLGVLNAIYSALDPKDLGEFGDHPLIFDNAASFKSGTVSGKGTYIVFSYDRLEEACAAAIRAWDTLDTIRRCSTRFSHHLRSAGVDFIGAFTYEEMIAFPTITFERTIVFSAQTVHNSSRNPMLLSEVELLGVVKEAAAATAAAAVGAGR